MIGNLRAPALWLLLLAVTVSASACSREVSGLAVAGHERLECAHPATPMFNVSLRWPGAPRIAIPTPPGWEPAKAANAPRFDASDMDMVMIRNPSLEVDGHVPNALVIVDNFTLDPSSADPEQRVIDEVIGDIQRSGKIVAQSTGTVCGHPSATVQYVIKGLKSSALIVAFTARDARVWRVRLNFLTHDPQNPQWRKDTQTMMNGLILDEIPIQ